MADSAIPASTSDCSKPKHFQIAKLKLSTLATEITQNRRGRCPIPIQFDQRPEAGKAPPLLAALFSGSSRVQSIGFGLPRPSFLQNNPLNMFTEMFSEITQEFATEASKFSRNQSEYLKECIKRSRPPAAVHRTIATPEAANAAITQFKDKMSFFVRLFFEIMEGPEDRKFKAACEMPPLPDIFSNREPKTTVYDAPSQQQFSNVKQLKGAASYNINPTSGFNSLFTNRRK